MKNRVVDASDFKLISKNKEEIFETDAEVELYIKNKNILTYELENQFVGYGIFFKINEDRNNYDIGMYVHPDFRKKGYGTQIIRSQVELCTQNDWNPICGCAIDNTASKKTLEKAGFISKHNMLEFFTENF